MKLKYYIIIDGEKKIAEVYELKWQISLRIENNEEIHSFDLGKCKFDFNFKKSGSLKLPRYNCAAVFFGV